MEENTNEVITEEATEVAEVKEDDVCEAEEADEESGVPAVLVIVGSMVLGGIAQKFIVQPLAEKVGNWWRKRQAEKAHDKIIFTEADEADEEDDSEK